MAVDTYYFLSAFEEDHDYSGATLIALTPEVCAKLMRAQIPYQVLDETCIERDLEKDAQAYFFEQLEWFRNFDGFLKEHIEYCRVNDISLASAHYNQLKYVIDSAISYAYVLRLFIQKHNPAKIIHVASYAEENVEPSIYALFYSPTTTIAQLLPYVCRSLGVPFRRKIVSCGRKKQGRASLDLLKNTIKDILLRLGFKSLVNLIRFKKYRCLMPHTKSLRQLRILFLHAGCFSVDEAIRKSLFAGAGVFTLGKNTIDSENSIVKRQRIVLDKGHNSIFADAVQAQCSTASCLCHGYERLFSWIRQKAGLDLTNYLAPYLSHFISHICYDTILKTEKLVAFYDCNKIDMVVMRASTGYDSAFTLTAASLRPHLKRVCIQHSCTALDGLLLPMTDLGFFDYYLATDSLSEKYFNSYSQHDIFKGCQVKQAAHYFRWIEARYQKRPRQRGRERILFAPSDARVGTRNLNNQGHWDGIWYFAFLRQLLAYFAERQDKFFIFKYRFGQHFMHKVMISYIVSQGYTNIILESRPLIDCFNLAQRLILDYPSSGLFESAAAGIPVLALYKSSFRMWDEALRFFGHSLKPFSDAAEAIRHIDDFLNTDSEKYKVNLPLKESNIIPLFWYIASCGRSP